MKKEATIITDWLKKNETKEMKIGVSKEDLDIAINIYTKKLDLKFVCYSQTGFVSVHKVDVFAGHKYDLVTGKNYPSSAKKIAVKKVYYRHVYDGECSFYFGAVIKF